MGAGAAIHVEHVSKTFVTKDGTTEAVADVSFDVPSGSFVSLIGPSGCGKTTVARMIGDLLAPTSGEITIDGESPSVARGHRRIGFVFQRPTLVAWRSVLKNVTLPLDVLGWPRAKKRERAMELLDLVGLADFANHRPDQLSGGMQHRAAIARALSYDPGVLIMDEPFGALDLITRDRMGFELLRIWAEAKKTVIFITHSIEEAVLLSTTVLAMAARPTYVQELVPITLERPRVVEHRQDPRFLQATAKLREMLEQNG
ncbi:MAG: ABC transporter ATP-binding protein [Bifidobacteriaceae bacterium]|jgi:NitT/TauT family transport system ATP-binding protein|nr:ABC transporter ATP-binding protein [Bifidobacteriaceae bacterium]